MRRGVGVVEDVADPIGRYVCCYPSASSSRFSFVKFTFEFCRVINLQLFPSGKAFYFFERTVIVRIEQGLPRRPPRLSRWPQRPPSSRPTAPPRPSPLLPVDLSIGPSAPLLAPLEPPRVPGRRRLLARHGPLRRCARAGPVSWRAQRTPPPPPARLQSPAVNPTPRPVTPHIQPGNAATLNLNP